LYCYLITENNDEEIADDDTEDTNNAEEKETEKTQEDSDDDDDKWMDIIEQILDGMDVDATEEQLANAKQVIDSQDPVAFHDVITRWGTSKDRIKKHRANLVAGFILISCNAAAAVPETIPPNAPESIDRVLGKN